MPQAPREQSVPAAVRSIYHELKSNTSAGAVFASLRELYAQETVRAIVAIHTSEPGARYRADASITQLATTAANLLTGIAVDYSYGLKLSQVAALAVKSEVFRPDVLLIEGQECQVYCTAAQADAEVRQVTPQRVVLEKEGCTLYVFTPEEARAFMVRTGQLLTITGVSYG